jgi:SPX domain protein involved in polyphosphate accumulation
VSRRDTLWLPADLTDNVDYNELKHLIKVNTAGGQAIAIPGHTDAAQKAFEDQFYLELCEQHERVNLFVHSKADEFGRKLRT